MGSLQQPVPASEDGGGAPDQALLRSHSIPTSIRSGVASADTTIRKQVRLLVPLFSTCCKLPHQRCLVDGVLLHGVFAPLC